MFQVIPPDEFIHVDSYKKLCENLPGITYASTEEVRTFFQRCEAGEAQPTVLVSALCDFSIREQEAHHPNADMVKMAASVDWQGFAPLRGFYQGIEVGPCCVPDHCRESDRYSAKTDRYTWFTFPGVPKNIVRWWTTNLDVSHPRMRWMPFGLNNDGPGSSLIPQFQGRPKTGLLYVNFQNNSFERVKLKRWFKRQSWATVRDKADLPVEQYLAELAEHKYVLAPFGNGLDCYRNLEAIYLGCIPILQESVFAAHYVDSGLPAVMTPDLQALTERALYDYYPQILNEEYSYDEVKLSTWRARFAYESRLLNP